VDWSKLPDLFAVALLAWAFASVARRSHAPVSKIWLTAWLLICLHFAAFMFLTAPGRWGILATVVGLVAIIWPGILFMWGSIPYAKIPSAPWMLGALLTANTLYVCALVIPSPPWLLTAAAILIGAGPLIVASSNLPRFSHPLRWGTVALYLALSVFLLSAQSWRPDDGNLELNAVLFTVYFGCCIHFGYRYRNATAGTCITIAGFLAWSGVFVVSPMLTMYFPAMHIESEVWNLPKYVVAVGMILLLLEEQIEHNKHLALHDVLTGLPNRRLFQDRLEGAVERARRSGIRAALLMVDLDHFKQVNDTLGHHVGDLLLERVASLFNARVRRSDTVARTGGDEFSVILEGPTSWEEAEMVGRSLLEMLTDPMELNGHIVRIGASMGISIFPDDATDNEALCVSADVRMYDNKRANALRTEHGPTVTPIRPLESKPKSEMKLA